jgi:RimJ/RimL family protein N-acetyltransferase
MIESIMTTTPPSAGITMRVAEEGDRFLIRRWLAQDDVQAWWGSRASAEAEIAVALSSMSSLCRMILKDGTPIGYAHAVDASTWGAAAAEIPSGAYDIDLFVADAASRGQGAGRAALDLLTAEVFATTFAVACSVVVSIRNEKAVRAFEHAGFSWVSVFQDPLSGPSWVMLKPRP